MGAEYVLKQARKLAKIEGMKEIWIKRDINEEEINKLKELREETKAKNAERMQEQVERFMWKVIDLRIAVVQRCHGGRKTIEMDCERIWAMSNSSC